MCFKAHIKYVKRTKLQVMCKPNNFILYNIFGLPNEHNELYLRHSHLIHRQ